MSRRSAIVLAVLLGLLFPAFSALPLAAQQPSAKKRVALVIGIDKYTSLEELSNPARDAAAFAELLEQYDFDVTLKTDLDRDSFERTLKDFRRDKVAGADTAVLYYGGHGMEVTDTSEAYDVVAPTDAVIDCDQEEHFRTIKLDDMVSHLRGAPNQIVFIDACRNIAFKVCRRPRGDGLRGGGFRGIKPVPAKGKKLLLTYATGQRAVAEDGAAGGHSPFAKVLLEELEANPRTNFYPLMFRVAGLVGAATRYHQMPQTVPEGGIPEVCLAGDDCSNTLEDVDAQRQRIRLLASNAEKQVELSSPVEAMLLALEALPDQKGKLRLPYEVVAERNLYAGLTARRELAVLSGHMGPVLSAAFSPDGKRIVTASVDGTARLWEADGREVVVLKGHTGPVMSAAFSPDGQRVVTASRDGTARVWDTDGREVIVLKGHTDRVYSAAFSPDGKRIVTASADGTARVWDTDGRDVAVLKVHTDPVLPVSSAAFSPDGKRIVTGSHNWTARLWEADGREVFPVLEGHTGAVWSAVFSPDGQRIVTASRDGTARLWEADGRAVAVVKGHTDPVVSAAFSPDGQRVVTASYDRTARVWDTDGREVVVLKGHTDRVYSAAFSPDSKRIVTASADGTARLWDADRRAVVVLKGHTGQVLSAAFSPDGERVVTASYDKTARVWDTDGRDVAVLKGHTGVVWSAAFSPDGKRIVTISYDSTARLWDTDGREVAVLAGHDVSSATFSPDGKRIVTASADGTARVWEADGREVAVLKGHTDEVRSAAFTPDGKRIVTASYDRTARVWEVDGREVVVLKGHTGAVQSAAFSPDGKRIVTASTDGTARLWPVFSTTQDLVDRTRAVVPRCLTKDQREQYGLPPDPPAWCATKWPYANATASTPPVAEGSAAAEWMDRWMATRAALGALRVARFKDPTYVVTEPISWEPNAEQSLKFKAVEVPKGFVTDFASIPWQFWSSLRSDGDYAYATVIHDWLYWSQQTDRETADEVFRQAMLYFKINDLTAWAIHQAVRLGGEQYWKENAALKAKGEKRILKKLPDDPLVTWDQWRARPDVFE